MYRAGWLSGKGLFLYSGGAQYEFCGGTTTLTSIFGGWGVGEGFLPLQENSWVGPQLSRNDFLPNSMISCYIFMDSENIIILTTKMHMKIMLLSIVAHISIPIYIIHSK